MRTRTSKPASSCRSYALWLLGRQSYSVQGLRDRLVRRGYAAEEAEDAVEYLASIGYLNDQAFADSLVTDRAANGHGPRRLRWDLRSRGVEAEVVEAAVAQVPAEQLRAQALQLARRRLGQTPLSDPAAQQRLFRYLLQRGYEIELIQEVLAELALCQS